MYLRVRRNIGRESYVGALGTSRIGGGEHNMLLGGDLELNLSENDFITAEISQTFDSRPDSADGAFPHGRTRIQLERRARTGLGLAVGGGITGSAYRPSLGFVQRTGVHDAFAGFGYGMLTQRAGLRQIRPRASGSVVGTNGSGRIETWNAGSHLEFESNSGAVLAVGLEYTFEDLVDAFPLEHGVEVPAGNHHFAQAGVRLAPAQGWTRGSGFTALYGGFFDGRITSLGVSPFWNISPYVRVTAFYSVDRIVFDSRSQDLTLHVVRLRPEVSLNTQFSTVAAIQYSSAANAATLNLRLRYNFREGNDLWVVYGHVANTETRSITPVPPRTMATALTVKYIHTFVL